MKSSTIYICYTFLIIVLSSILVDAQRKEDLKAYSDYVETTTISKAYYHIYDPPFLAKPIMNHITEAKNRYVETFMVSKISEDNYSWLEHNTLGRITSKTPRYFLQKKGWDKDNTYYELISKLEFVHNGDECAFIRFRLYGGSITKPPVGVYFLRKKKGRWHYDVENVSMNLTMAIAMTRPERLGEVLKGAKNKKSLLKDIIKKSSRDGNIDLFKLGYEILLLSEQQDDEAKRLNKYFFESLNW